VQWHAKALALREELLDPDALEVAQSTEHLALAYDSQAQRDAAEPLMHRALSLSERLLPADDPQRASTLSHVGMFIVVSRAQYDEGERMLPRALEIRKKAFGLNHAATAADFRSTSASARRPCSV
jgi:hypothetical protein